jgi:cytochrome c5
VSFKTVLKVVISVSAIVISALSIAAVKDEISARISPVGGLCMSGDECAAAPVTVAAGPRSGEEVYNTKCLACHATGAAGAPKLGDAAAWSARLGQGLDTLYTHAIDGFNGMPAKGLCMDCSDDEIKASVDYILDNSK